ncbi:MAG TPA: dienelactone hydrolase family protein [Dissulfurispiraceae bacterium]|nr:dienelactone hydrolase family protein [Dissulfurispiraceae bacterium]
MRHFRCVGLLTVVVLTIALTIAGTSFAGTRIDFMSLDKTDPLKVSGMLYLPENNSKPYPAVVIVHGTTGIDSRGEFYRKSILQAGIAIFEVDFKTGIYTSPKDRPSPEALVALGFAALKELRKLPAVDPGRIGIMGFSMGGHLTVNTAIEKNRKLWMGSEKGFAAHAAFYPVCKYIIPKLENSGSGMTGAPMIIFYGTKDSYGDGTAVPEFKDLLLKKYKFQVITVEYPGCSHGFNRNAPALSYYDSAAIGGKGFMTWDPEAANDSLSRVVAFLRQTLSAK